MSSKEYERGNALLQQGHASQAAQVFQSLIQRSGDDAYAHAGLGHALLQLGREAEARDALLRACSLSDRISHAYGGLAWLALKQGDAGTARNMAGRAIALYPSDAASHFVLAQVQLAEGRMDESEATFARAAKLDARYVEARNALGSAAFDRGQFAAAARHFGAYARGRPNDAKAWLNFGLSLARAGDMQAARAPLQRAAELAPDQVKPAALLVSVLLEAGGDHAELIAALNRLVALSPDALDARLTLARTLIAEHRYAEAKPHLRHALRLDPRCLVARWLDFQRPDDVVQDEAARAAYLQRWREGIAWFEQLDWNDAQLARQADETLASTTNFYLAYLGQPLLDEHRRNAAVVRKLTQLAAPGAVEAPLRRIGRKRRKIAVFSASLTNHSVERMWSGALLRLDPAEFELAVFSPAERDTQGAQRWRDAGAHFDAGNRTAGVWVTAIQAFEPDIMLFPDIGMHQFVQALASLRHAPVQLTTWGHPVTSGMATIDYFLGADAFEPEDAQAHYSEILVRLPRTGVWLERPVRGAAVARTEDTSVRLLCVQSISKLHAAHDALFARILAASPQARLDVLCSATAQDAAALERRMRAEFANAGIDFDARCRVYARLPLERYQAFIDAADVCLDSLDFSGCITTLDAIASDKPVVTLPGALARGRQTSGILRLLELPELIAASADDYVRIAVRAAADSAWRAELQTRIRERKAVLFEDAAAVAALADFLREVEHPSLRDA